MSARRKPPSRPLHEPEFVAAGAKSFQHVFEPAPLPTERRRWNRLAVGLVAITVCGAALTMIALHADREDRRVVEPSPAPRDAARPVPADADLIVEARDAALAAADAMLEVRVPRSDGGTRPSSGIPQGHPAYVKVEVMTRPGDANVYVGTTFRGPSGVTLTERYGTRLHISCRSPGYQGGVDVTFDGTVDNVMCTAVRHGMCVKDLHNPFDQCDDDAGPELHPRQ
jgi:hypothetical protein